MYEEIKTKITVPEALLRAQIFLGRVRRQERRINNKMAMLQRMKEAATRVTGCYLHAGGGGPGDSRAEAAAAVVDLEREIDRDIDHLVALKNEIWLVLKDLESPEDALLLDDLYIAGMTMKEAAKRAKVTPTHAYRLRKKALIEVGGLLAMKKPMAGYIGPTPRMDGLPISRPEAAPAESAGGEAGVRPDPRQSA